MKKDTVLATILQLVMGSILIIFGLLLNRGDEKNVALAFLRVPGVVILISMIFNFFKFKSQYFFPVATCTLALIGDIAVMVGYHLQLSPLSALGILATIGITGLICTLFHWLHGEILK